MVYLGDNWPDGYRNTIFMCNLHGNRVNNDLLEQHGSGYVARHGKDFLLANDPWFRGIDLHYGPDGGVYLSDWTDTGECHNHVVVDRTNGRIYKVTYGQAPARPAEDRPGREEPTPSWSRCNCTRTTGSFGTPGGCWRSASPPASSTPPPAPRC